MFELCGYPNIKQIFEVCSALLLPFCILQQVVLTCPRLGGQLTVSIVRQCDFLDVFAVNSIFAMYTELKSVFLLEIDGL